jgi:hypothetical protein
MSSIELGNGGKLVRRLFHKLSVMRCMGKSGTEVNLFPLRLRSEMFSGKDGIELIRLLEPSNEIKLLKY